MLRLYLLLSLAQGFTGCVSVDTHQRTDLAVAADPRADFDVRRAAAWSLTLEDARKLRPLLSSRIRNEQGEEQQDDLAILSIVSDDESVTELQRKWPSPAKDGKIGGRAPSRWELAANPNVDVFTRKDAAGALNEEDSTKLRRLLLARIPGKLNMAANNDISVLSVVANEGTATELESKNLIEDEQGHISAAIARLIERIRARHPATERIEPRANPGK